MDLPVSVRDFLAPVVAATGLSETTVVGIVAVIFFAVLGLIYIFWGAGQTPSKKCPKRGHVWGTWHRKSAHVSKRVRERCGLVQKVND